MELYLINNIRANECFWIFSNTLPIGKNQTDKLVQTFGQNVAVILPDLLSKLGKVCLTYPEEFEGYLEYIQQMIKYIREETDVNPIEFIEINQEERDQMMKHMRIQIGKSE